MNILLMLLITSCFKINTLNLEYKTSINLKKIIKNQKKITIRSYGDVILCNNEEIVLDELNITSKSFINNGTLRAKKLVIDCIYKEEGVFKNNYLIESEKMIINNFKDFINLGEILSNECKITCKKLYIEILVEANNLTIKSEHILINETGKIRAKRVKILDNLQNLVLNGVLEYFEINYDNISNLELGKNGCLISNIENLK